MEGIYVFDLLTTQHLIMVILGIVGYTATFFLPRKATDPDPEPLTAQEME